MTIHDFDMARFLLGEEPTTVFATAAAMTSDDIARAGDIDTACVTLQCPSGRMAVITNSRRASFGYDQRIEALGSLGACVRKMCPPQPWYWKEPKAFALKIPCTFSLNAIKTRIDWNGSILSMC